MHRRALPGSSANYTQHEEVARRELPKDRPFVLLGESFSGPVAVSIAASAPPNLLGVILCVSFATCPHRLLSFCGHWCRSRDTEARAGLHRASRIDRPVRDAELRAAHSRALSHVSSLTLTARLRAMAYIDVREQLRTLRCRCCTCAPPRIGSFRTRGDEVAACARDARLVEIDGPHFLLQTQPQECARHIGRSHAPARNHRCRIRLTASC